jgi:hypothetical protein
LTRAHTPELSGNNTERQLVYYNNKKHFDAFVSEQILSCADWRSKQQKRFPDDDRNAKATSRLLKLESEIVISDDVWAQLQTLVPGSHFMTAISATNRDVGFRTYPADFSAWLDYLQSNLIRN